ncbi:aminotransferase class I/II-fold pyridoxal phosphate-dependent enzyme [Candidatus Poribacteria bacterium]|nr:aminotransferase class I/II-fold pyridoxal phosphate-dependent enzyme [Candidatus Poribacteria bacterium]
MINKNDWKNLSIFKGEPTFKEKLYVGRPNIGDRAKFLDRVNNILDRKWLTNYGPYVQELESKIANLIGVKHCMVICNATIALEILIRAVDLKGEVIIPSFTFIATAHALQWQEITPVFCDIDPKTHNINPDCIQQMITPHTTGIIGVHLWGRHCNIDELSKIAKKNNLKLLFDAAHAFGCSYKNQMIGNFGMAEVFSFHATKFLNTFEGGAIVTNSDDLAKKIRLMTNFGFVGFDNVKYIGTNGKMSEMSAAMGLTSLESLDYFIEVNKRNYYQYKNELAEIQGINIIKYKENEKNNFQYKILEIDQEKTKLNRDELQEILWAENVIARRYFFPGCHRMEPYISYFPHSSLLLQQTERLAKILLSLPTGTGVSSEDINKICNIIKIAIKNGTDVNKQLKKKK